MSGAPTRKNTGDVPKRGNIANLRKGGGRPKGVPNKSTIAIKEAILSVYAKLQEGSGNPHGHFAEWAMSEPTEFYKLAAKLLPLQVNNDHTGEIVVRWTE